MADRNDYYFHQSVTEGELDSGFNKLEIADRKMFSDFGNYGILTGFAAGEDPGGPSVSINVTAGKAYDKVGQRLFSSADILQDITTDTLGNPTAPTAGNRRWVSVYLRFGRLLSDPRTDGNGNPVNFSRAESLNPDDNPVNNGVLLVVAGGEALITDPLPARPALDAQAILVADVLYTDGDTSFAVAQISTGRAERWQQKFRATMPDIAEFDGGLDSGEHYSLIFEISGPSTGTYAGRKSRIYMSTKGLVFTQNALWNPEDRTWNSEIGFGGMCKIHLDNEGIKMYRTGASTTLADDAWPIRFDLSAVGGGSIARLSASGEFFQQGTTHSMWGLAFSEGAAKASAFTYNIPFSSTPSSVTASAVGSDVSVSAVNITSLNEYGGKAQLVPAVINSFTSAFRLIEAIF